MRKRTPHPDWLRHDAWFTPGDVAEQVLRGVAALGVSPRTILDLGAGRGVFGQRAGFVWPGAHRTAIEIRPEEGEHLARWYETVHLADFRDLDARTASVDLIVGNFAFRHLERKVQWGLAQAQHVLTIVPASFGAEERAEHLLQHRPPGDSLRLAGRISFMYGRTDFQHHEALLWGPATSKRAWVTHPLPLLPLSSRRWIIVPGEERAPRPLARVFWPEIERAA